MIAPLSHGDRFVKKLHIGYLRVLRVPFPLPKGKSMSAWPEVGKMPIKSGSRASVGGMCRAVAELKTAVISVFSHPFVPSCAAL
jgi:hypothetical protein